MAIDSTISGPDANSYASLAEAEAFFSDHQSGTWTDADWDDRERALISATRRLDVLDFLGRRTHQDQALSWPRTGLYDRDGWGIPEDEIPRDVKYAQFELTRLLLADAAYLDETGLEEFSSLRIGPISMDLRGRKIPGELPEEVKRFLNIYLAYSSSVNVRLVRG